MIENSFNHFRAKTVNELLLILVFHGFLNDFDQCTYGKTVSGGHTHTRVRARVHTVRISNKKE